MKTKPDIKDLLTRGVSEIIPDKKEFEKLLSKKKIKLYLGIDPTGGKLHLGHTINLLKLQEFAELGHEAILIIGTGTVLAGDPSQRDKARKKISQKEVKENIKTWKKQAGKVVDLSKVKIKYNGDWILKLKYEDIVNIASNISAIKLFQREMFQRRVKKGNTVWTHETLYPLMQGYDSVYLDVDLEIGGTDQVFNMLIGRDLQKKMNNREKFVMTCNMITGTDGQQMSKTSGNCIWIEDSSKDKFGKIMSLPDGSIFDYFELVTRVPMAEIEEMRKSGTNPKSLKAKLAKEIVTMYHGEKEAEKAKKEFEKVFSKKEIPTNIPEIKIKEKEINILDLLVKTKMASSKSEAKRLVEQGGIKIDNKVKKDWKEKIMTKHGSIVQVGKRKFIKLI